MADHSDPQMALMFSFYKRVERKGPDSLQRERDVWKKYSSSYGYVFYLGRAA